MPRDGYPDTLALVAHLRGVGETAAADRMEQLLGALAMFEASHSDFMNAARYTHVKTRGEYWRFSCSGELQSSGGPVEEGAVLTTYISCADYRVWHRPTHEFDDGRFLRIAK